MFRSLIVGAVFLASLAELGAQVPHLLNYQGRITSGGLNWDGAGQFKFALVNQGGTQAFWMNSPDLSPADGVPDSPLTLPVAKGLYSVVLGDTSLPGMAAIPAAVFANPEVYLRVWFNDGTHGWERLSPDQRFAAVGYAMMAENVPDGSITTPKLAAGAVTSDRMAPGAVTADRLAPGAVTPASIGAETPESAQARVDLLGSSLAGGLGSLKAILADARKDACIHIISDSTNAGGLWSQQLATWIGQANPRYTVKTTNWIAFGAGWTNPVTVQTGSGGGERRWEFPAGTQYTPNGYGPDFPMPAGDLDLRAKVRVDSSAGVNIYLAKWSNPASRCFYFGQDPTSTQRKLFFIYTVDGVTPVSIYSTAGLGANGIADGATYWTRVTVDIDNGSGGKTFTFYTSLDGSTWTQLGTPLSSTATGILPVAGMANATCTVGGYGGIAFLSGAIYAAQIRTGIDGPVTHPQNLDAWAFNEGKVKLDGAPEFWITNAALSGASVDTFLGVPDLNYCRNHSPQVILISLSHNSPREGASSYINKIQTLVDRVRAVYGPIPRIIFLTQNPELRIPNPIDPNNQHTDAVAAHRTQFIAWASSKGYGIIDTWGAFEKDPRQLETLIGTNTWSAKPITSLSGDGTTVTVNVSDMSFLAPASVVQLAVMGTKALDGNRSPHNKGYRITAKSANTTGPGWVQFASTLTDAIQPGVGTVGPCDGIHPSAEGYTLWAETVFAAFKRGLP